MKPAVRLIDVGKRFGDAIAVRGVNLDIAHGTLHALLGPSGCGKTTLLRLITGLETLDSGSITLDGQLVSGRDVCRGPETRGVGMVFQDYALFPHMTVANNIAFGLSPGGGRREKIRQLLALTGLTHLAGRMPATLSGGERQRVALARALAPEPMLLLMDEPFSNLDAKRRVEVRAEVRRILRNLRITALFVTHDQEEAFSIADRVSVMFEGGIEQTDTPEMIYHRPANRRIAEFVGDANFVQGFATGLCADTPLGVLDLMAPCEGPVTIMIRPEQVRFVTDDGILMEVRQKVFFGHDMLLALRGPDGTALQARTVPDACALLGRHVRCRVQGNVLAWAENAGMPGRMMTHRARMTYKVEQVEV